MPRRFRTLREFWPHYLREHSQPETRAWHYAGTALALACVAAAAAFQSGGLVVAALLCGYGFAWIGHACIERNRPATFGHVWWSILSDLRMFVHFATGTLAREIEKARSQGDPTEAP